MTQQEELVGIDQAMAAMGRGGTRYPRLGLDAGDRAHFWCLTSGRDKWFAGAQFHKTESDVGGNKQYRTYVCPRSLGKAGGSCELCEMGHTDVQRQFALWVYVDMILHNGNNPDPEGADWPVVKQKEMGPSGEITRTLFKEEVGEPMVLQLASGRDSVRFNMFTSIVFEKGTLQLAKYQLKRIGTGIDTNYELRQVENKPVPEEILALVEERQLTPIVDLFLGSLSSSQPPTVLVAGEAAGELEPLEGEIEEAGEYVPSGEPLV